MNSNNALFVTSEAFEACKIAKPSKGIELDNRIYYSVEKNKNIKFDIDLKKMTLNLFFPEKKEELINISMNDINFEKIRPLKPGAYINYDFSFQKNFKDNLYTGALFDTIFFNQYGVFNTDLIMQYNSKSSKLVRLNSLWTYDLPEKMLTTSLGDAIITTNSWTYPTRFIGFKFYKNFDTQPNYRYLPQPVVSGIANVPTRVDIYLENQLLTSQNINSGAYHIDSIPFASQGGEITVKTQDLLNRETIITLPYYTSNLLLKKNINQYSYQVGFERLDYGIKNFKYGRFITSGTFHRGVTNKWTLGTNIETFNNQLTIGIDSAHILFNHFEFNWAMAGSLDRIRYNGQLAQIGLKQNLKNHSIGFNYTQTSQNFRQLGTNEDIKPAKSNLQTYYNVSNYKLGSFGANFSFRKGRTEPNLGILILNYSYTLKRNLNLSIIYSKQFSTENRDSYYLSFFYTPKTHYQSIMSYTKDSYNNDIELSYSKGLIKENDYGYKISKSLNSLNEIEIDGDLKTQKGVYHGKYAKNKINNYLQFDASGSIVLFDKNIELTRKINDSFIYVKGPKAGSFDVEYQNQVKGRLNNKGVMIISDSRPYIDNEIKIDTHKIPISMSLNNTEKKVTPYYRAGSLVHFSTHLDHNYSFNLVDSNNAFLPIGTKVRLNSEDEYFVGYEGRVFVFENKLKPLLSGHAFYKGKQCKFNINKKNNNHLVELGIIKCA